MAKKQYHRALGLPLVRVDAGSQWGRYKSMRSSLPVPPGGHPDEQYRVCGICKVQRGPNIDSYAHYVAKIPGRTSWIFLCSQHFHEYGCKLGPTRGQRLVINPKWADHKDPPK
jgi:hypothetical protein